MYQTEEQFVLNEIHTQRYKVNVTNIVFLLIIFPHSSSILSLPRPLLPFALRCVGSLSSRVAPSEKTSAFGKGSFDGKTD